MLVKEALKLAAQKFTVAGIDTPELDARILLQHATGKSREYIIANPDAESAEEEFLKLVERRIRREPVAHITGRKEFYGREFMVSADVLTPRPETELIIDTVKEYYNSLETLQILELGVGSGCIITTLCLEFPNSNGLGVDISNNALAIARRNAYNLGVQGVQFYCSDWTKNIELKNFDLVVSNPPYISAADSTKLEAELGFEPALALYAGSSGLDAYRQIAEELKSVSLGHAIFEIGQGQENDVTNIFEKNGFKLKAAKKDIAGIIRVLVFTK